MAIRPYLLNASTKGTWALRNLKLMPELGSTGLSCTEILKERSNSALTYLNTNQRKPVLPHPVPAHP